MPFLRNTFIAVLACCALAACTVRGTSAATTPPVTTTQSIYVAQDCTRKGAPCPAPSGFVQAIGKTTVTITAGIDNPSAIGFDAAGNAYVGNATAPFSKTQQSGAVTVYAPGSTTPLRTISNINGAPHALLLDASSNLYVVSDYKYQCCQIKGSVAVYGANSSTLLRQLTGIGGFPGIPAFDASGNLYQPNFDVFPGYVTIYPPGATMPSSAIQKGIGFPLDLAFDPSGNLFVLNGTFTNTHNVTVYAPGTSVVARTITDGLGRPYAIAVDSSGNLYVANQGSKAAPSSVTVYAPGSTSVLRTITKGIDYPIAIAIDSKGNLYVANSPEKRANAVTVYAPGTDAPSATYTVPQEITAIGLAPPI